MFLVSIAVLVLGGAVLLAAVLVLTDGLRAWLFPLLTLELFIHFAALFILEYSVHMQRLRRSFLLDVFVKRARVIYLIGGGALALFALICVLFSRVAGIWPAGSAIAPGSDADASLNGYITAAKWLYILFSALLGTAAFLTNRLYHFHEGIIRRQRYPFTIFLVFLLVPLIPALRAGTERDFLWWFFILPVVLFAVRAYHEYFVYRMRHLNDLHAKLEESEKSRTEIINSVITSSAEEDYRIINGTLTSFLERARRSLTVSGMMFGSLMTYRKKGDLLQVDSPNMIVNYCVPLARLEAVKTSP